MLKLFYERCLVGGELKYTCPHAKALSPSGGDTLDLFCCIHSVQLSCCLVCSLIYLFLYATSISADEYMWIYCS